MGIRCFFFVKQKSAFKVGIRSMISSVCSADLASANTGRARRFLAELVGGGRSAPHRRSGPNRAKTGAADTARGSDGRAAAHRKTASGQCGGCHDRARPELRRTRDQPRGDAWAENGKRSEEHTSELQSLMRISYAVFCLKKKKT